MHSRYKSSVLDALLSKITMLSYISPTQYKYKNHISCVGEELGLRFLSSII